VNTNGKPGKKHQNNAQDVKDMITKKEGYKMKTITEWDQYARMNNSAIYCKSGKMVGILANEDYNVF